MINEKRPRQWAEELAALATKEERLQALQRIPESMRPMVKEHLKTIKMWRDHADH